ncbi:small multi-drug export protein [Hoyosella rhizosphaerae]|uniref:Small multi-drug export protein n=1 Tax=Hoyosella rhizosphaerae TaxID=1755582 RepID=A0A916U153_9ACTN|nr:small multi-drug export protein [Hoyosella rhizosphaerae]MBN4927038.1 small multi-drug export protein [Hoyosella rhizosphaerae]GGC54522.1 hypothetical protein GCM10011410_03640 [Hoyosella rhizosphaerae]
MLWTEFAAIAGVFIGGAAPWLEAIIVIPAAIVAGMNPAVAFIAAVTGNLLTVAIAAWFGESLRAWWVARKERRRAHQAASDPGDSASAPDRGSAEMDHPVKSRRRTQIENVINRWGMPALAVLGPIGLGTQLSAVVAVGMGVTARVAFLWIGVATVVWSIIAVAVTLGGLSAFGVG